MKVYFPDYNKQYENSNESVNQLVQDINAYIQSTENLLLSHLNIDGVDVYEDHYQYLLDTVVTIDEVKVIVQTKQEMINGLQQSLNEYLERALPAIESLSNQFYQGESEEVWNSFADLTDGLQWIISAVETLIHYSEEETKSYYNNVSDKLQSTLQELMEVIEIKDTVTIADIIQYEIVEILSELKQTVHH